MTGSATTVNGTIVPPQDGESIFRTKRLRRPNSLYRQDDFDLPKSPSTTPKSISASPLPKSLSLEGAHRMMASDAQKTLLNDGTSGLSSTGPIMRSLQNIGSVNSNGTAAAKPKIGFKNTKELKQDRVPLMVSSPIGSVKSASKQVTEFLKKRKDDISSQIKRVEDEISKIDTEIKQHTIDLPGIALTLAGSPFVHSLYGASPVGSNLDITGTLSSLGLPSVPGVPQNMLLFPTTSSLQFLSLGSSYLDPHGLSNTSVSKADFGSSDPSAPKKKRRFVYQRSKQQTQQESESESSYGPERVPDSESDFTSILESDSATKSPPKSRSVTKSKPNDDSRSKQSSQSRSKSKQVSESEAVTQSDFESESETEMQLESDVPASGAGSDSKSSDEEQQQNEDDPNHNETMTKRSGRKVKKPPLKVAPEVPEKRTRRVPSTESGRFARAVMRKLTTHRLAFPFLKPVDPVELNIPDYFDIIKTPMDFSTIQDKLNTDKYTTFDDFSADVRLVFQNCNTYNHPGSDIVKMSNALSEIFEERYQHRPQAGNMLLQYEDVESRIPVYSESDKQRIALAINELPQESQAQVIRFLMAVRSLSPNEEEIEVDIDSFSNAELKKLDELINKLVNKTKRPRKSRQNPNSSRKTHSETHSMIDISEEPLQSPTFSPPFETPSLALGMHSTSEAHITNPQPPRKPAGAAQALPPKTESSTHSFLMRKAENPYSVSSDSEPEPEPEKFSDASPIEEDNIQQEGDKSNTHQTSTPYATMLAPSVIPTAQELESKPLTLLNADDWSNLEDEDDEGGDAEAVPKADDRTSALWNQFQTKKQEQEIRMRQLEEHEENVRKMKELQEEQQRVEALQRQKEYEEEQARKSREVEEAAKERERAREQARLAAQQERERLARMLDNPEAALLDGYDF
eukprot:TRINITY_DN4374_c0_g1_i1.p1 TRINITY_DN4374_c0_g1~~TRINITY_DN4374_c0_g1_i1.p1  ORF type:complete len:913 (+),score=182.26 TRINITY_DN4374_c0_g1_i1:195-2933(+)